MKNLAKSYRQAGIKGMSEGNGEAKVITPSMKHVSKYSIVERLEGEGFQSWKARCTKKAD